MILSAGMRTDIPAFYSKWFINRVKEGYVYVRNPYYKNKVTKYSFSPDVIDLLCFGTKNPHTMLEYIDELSKNYKMLWYVTITPYGKDIEPNVNVKKYNPNSPFLIGNAMEGDIITNAKQYSWKAKYNGQISIL